MTSHNPSSAVPPSPSIPSGIFPSSYPVHPTLSRTVADPSIFPPASPTPKFAGTISQANIPPLTGGKIAPGPFLARAIAAQSHASTPDDIRLAIFCDGSSDGGGGGKHGPYAQPSGYASVFRLFAPGSAADGKVAAQAFAVVPALSSHLAELLAILQSIEIATAMLESAAAATADATAAALGGPRRRATVLVFSDSMASLCGIAGWTGVPVGRHLQPRRSVLEAIGAASVRLRRAGGGLDVELVPHWVKAHVPNGGGAAMHELADELAGRARTEARSFCVLDGEEVPTGTRRIGGVVLPGCVFEPFREVFAAEARQRLEYLGRSSGGQSSRWRGCRPGTLPRCRARSARLG